MNDHEPAAGAPDSQEPTGDGLDSSNSNAASELQPENKRLGRPANIWTLASKELRETLRDRRTLTTLLLMPLLVYPLLGLMFQGFFLPTLSQTEAKSRFLVALDSENDFRLFQMSLRSDRRFITRLSSELQPGEEDQDAEGTLDFVIRSAFEPTEMPESIESMVSNGLADVAVKTQPGSLGNSNQQITWGIISREGSPNSRQAAETIERYFVEQNLALASREFAERGLELKNRILFVKQPIESNISAPISIVAIIPLILTLMTITGAVYPAIDLTAGERERGTLESLIAAPIPRLRILLGKFVAVIAVALLTALLNIIGMMTTLWVFQLEGMLFPESGLQLFSFIKLFLLLIVFAGFFSSILLAVTSFARSFKEGQAYLIPVMLFSIGPSLLSLKPDLNIDGILAIAPLVNIVLLAREVLQGTATLGPALVAIGSTVLYSLLAVSFAAKVFGTDAVLYGCSGSWKDLLKAPKKKRFVADESIAMLCLALLIPGTFLWNGLIGRFAESGVPTQFFLVVTGLVLVFAIVPLTITSLRRVRIQSGYRLFGFSPFGLFAAVLLGLGLGPILAQLIVEGMRLQEYLFGASDSSALLEAGKQQVEKWKQLQWFVVIPCLGIVPGVVEELFFRGCLFQSLRKRFSPLATILTTALVFGLFHLITAGSLGLNRLLPTTIMGIVLGFVCYKTGSVIPGMFLHSIHNMLIVGLAYFRDDMIDAGWISENSESIPTNVLIVAAVLTLIGFAMLILSRTPPEELAESTTEE